MSGGGLGARRTGLIALAIAALMPFGIRYAAEARMYSLVMALAAGGYLLVDDLLDRPTHGTQPGGRHRRSGVGRRSSAGGRTTGRWRWPLAVVGLLAWCAWRETDPERCTGGRLLIGSLLVGGVLFLPWVSALLYQSGHTGTPWGEHFGPASVVVITIQDFSGDALTSYLAVASHCTRSWRRS